MPEIFEFKRFFLVRESQKSPKVVLGVKLQKIYSVLKLSKFPAATFVFYTHGR